MSDETNTGIASDADRVVEGLHRIDQKVDKGAARRNVIKGLAADAPQGLAMSLAFAAISAAFGAIVSQLSNQGSQAFVERRHRKASR